MKVCAIVVTYNRLAFLKTCINRLKSQSQKLDLIIVVNNGSSDGTKDWLEEQNGIKCIHQANLGGAGGFNAGMQYAYKQDVLFDFFWLMDDDVYPHIDCLSNLVANAKTDDGIVAPLRFQNDKIFLNEHLKINFENPWKPLLVGKVNQEMVNSDDLEVGCITFEGPLIRREVIDKIGFPDKDFWIFMDDTDFSYRTTLAGYNIRLIHSAKMDKEVIPKTVIHHQLWRIYYLTRNAVYLDRVYGNFKVKTIRPFLKLVSFLLRRTPEMMFLYHKPLVAIKQIPVYFRAFFNGMRRKRIDY